MAKAVINEELDNESASYTSRECVCNAIKSAVFQSRSEEYFWRKGIVLREG